MAEFSAQPSDFGPGRSLITLQLCEAGEGHLKLLLLDLLQLEEMLGLEEGGRGSAPVQDFWAVH